MCDYVLTTPSNPNDGVVDWKIIVDMNTLGSPVVVKERFDSQKARSADSAKRFGYTFEEYGTRFGGTDSFLDDSFGLAVQSGTALLYVDARLPNYVGEDQSLPAQKAEKLAAREKVAGAVAQALAPRFQ